MTDKTQFSPILYHGTYYDFDYFWPLTHFGKRINAETNLNEGKWKRDPNIDITKPKIIPVTLHDGNYDEIPDLNDHSVQNYMGILFQYMCGNQMSGFIKALNIADEAKFKKQCEIERKKIMNTDIIVPWEFDWVCEPVGGKMSIDEIRDELDCETLFEKASPDNLFFQRMILYFESIGVNGFKYKNFTEGPGEYSYIIFRQNAVKRMDKDLPAYKTPTAQQAAKIREKQVRFAATHPGRKLTVTEKEMLLNELQGFYVFRFNELKSLSEKSWAQKISADDNSR